MIIDAHTHIKNGEFPHKALELKDRLGIEQFLCCNIGDFVPYPTPDEIQEMNNVLAKNLRRYPDLLKGYCYLNPRFASQALTELRRCVEEFGMIGIKLWIATTADHPSLDPILEYAAERNLIILAHAWDKTVRQYPHESSGSHIARAAIRHPNARFLMAHLGGQAESGINSVAQCPNVMVDTAGTVIGMGEVALAVERLGAHRVAFASDLNVGDLSANVGKILGAKLAPDAESLVFSGNISRWLKEVKL